MAKVSLRTLVSAGDGDSVTDVPNAERNIGDPAVTVTKIADGAGRDSGVAPKGGARKPVKKIATVYTTDAIFQRLREHVSSRKAKGEILSYGIASLLAVRQHRHELSCLWHGAASEDEGNPSTADTNTDIDDDLFGITIRRAAPKKVPWQLHGASPAQVQLLDELTHKWGAPSRSVLVQEALIRYLPRAARKSVAQADRADATG